MTIGRATTNRIAVPDEVCSRNHCEVFQSGGRWMVRDLGSRTGTRVEGQYIDEDWPLQDGQRIQLGGTVLCFTHDPRTLASSDTTRRLKDALEADTSPDLSRYVARPQIVHRTNRSRYQSAEAHTRDRLGRDLARLYRLATDMTSATDAAQLAGIVLDVLLSSTHADIGAVLAFSPKVEAAAGTVTLGDPAGGSAGISDALEVVNFKSLHHAQEYKRVSETLSRLALTERDAILARDVPGDSRLNKSDSHLEISLQSVICAPLRAGDSILGLVHLYSTDPDRVLEQEDLEFTLAVADQLALALDALKKQAELAAGLERAKSETQELREQLRIETELVGESASMKSLRAKISRIAPANATVLIRGESGVGKELVARAIHLNSPRRTGPFITMNCAALSESLLESELFGHEKGSFTGAVTRKIGKFEQADGGTLFLDEVGEMSPAIQAKFLRVLEGHPFERVGGGQALQVDVRVVAATNRALEEAVNQKTFRKDLYFRLQVVELQVDPLRDRRSDIPVLARHFLERFCRKLGRPMAEFSAAALEALKSYAWPGNVRELQNTIERAVILATSTELSPADLQLSALGTSAATPATVVAAAPAFQPISLDQLEQAHILAMLEWTNWNKSQASQLLGIERSTLDRKLKRYDVDRHSRRGGHHTPPPM
jgi:Nif-specific regulatory protein